MATIPYNGFQKGFITEGNPLQFPEGATKSELNFDLLVDGTRRKRLGLEMEESGSVFLQDSSTPEVVSSHLWDTQTDGQKFVVTQVDYKIYLWSAQQNPITQESGVELYDFSSNMTRRLSYIPYLDFASGQGYMIIVGEGVKPRYFEYKQINNDGTLAIESANIDIRIRDFTGIEDGLAIDARPSILSQEHKYNISNQGWDITPETFIDGVTGDIVDPLGLVTLAIFDKD